ncbi:MAG: HlyD family efflux transporter periplasmic adaptor subunit [Deltaproteobacteria bacterium]|nr:HlyD family efflux transporter periplasmic adaptor subunit [Deltaproteobacteria bacterium]
MRKSCCVLLVVMIATVNLYLFADDAKTYMVTRPAATVEVVLKGVFEAQRMQAIAIEPAEWANLKITSVASQGEKVKKGDALICLDVKELDETITEQKASLELQNLKIEKAKKELELSRMSAPKEIEEAKRTLEIAAADLKLFAEEDKKLEKEQLERMVDEEKFKLEKLNEELRQLEEMFSHKEMMEATEKIVIKKAKRDVDWAKISLEDAKRVLERLVKTTQPRTEATKKEAVRQAEIALAKTRIAQFELAVKKLELETSQRQLSKDQSKLNRLLADRAQMEVKSPLDGIVYYGQCVRGRFVSTDMLSGALKPGGVPTKGQVLMTVANPEAMIVRASVAENELHRLRKGLQAKVTPTGFPEVSINGFVENLSLIPLADGNFDVCFGVDEIKERSIMPGMTCSVRFITKVRESAVTVPASAVFTNESGPYVFLQIKNEKSPKVRPVKTGNTENDKTEIVSGLEPGDTILLSKPEK